MRDIRAVGSAIFNSKKRVAEANRLLMVIRLVTDQDWWHKAMKEIAKYWRHKRERRQTAVDY